MSSDSSPLAFPPDWDAIARFLAGESSDEEATKVRRWLADHPADRALADELRAAVNLVSDALPDLDVEAALANVHTRMAEVAPSRLIVERGGGIRRWQAGVALAGLLAAGIAAVMVVQSRRRAPTAAASEPRIYATGVGQRDSVRLADGSRVVLGPQSRLVVPGDFGAARRAVDLTGDAYFDVHHDATKPFSVRAGGALIEDIGTTFAIESDAGEGMRVSVVTGSVRLRGDASAATSGVVLTAGDRGSLDANGTARVEHDVVRDDDVAWTVGRLVFNDTPLAQVIPEIQRWYGITLRVPDSALLRRTVHTSFSGESADKALEILGLTLGAHVERHGDTAIVTSTRGATGR